MSPPDDRWKEKVQKLLEKYTASVQKMSYEALIVMHREYVRLRLDDLAEITKAELERRKLPID